MIEKLPPRPSLELLWRRAKEHLAGLRQQRWPRTPGISLERATPILPVQSCARALPYYNHQLGFETRWTWGEPVTFACVSRGKVSLFLSAGGHHGSPGAWVFIDVEDVDALHREYEGTKAIIREPPTQFPWGSREMNVEDLDGNRMRFASASI